ncbi:MAG: TonB-dependent receptor [Gemmatimonadetes bacterium]|nr:TonB-dependent receptor [Gemmatimonadota bacterium]
MGSGWASAVLLFLAASPLGAQASGVVQGVVTQAGDTTAVRGGHVAIEGTLISALTDQGGRFRLAGIPPGVHTLIVRAVGYRPTSVPIEVGAGQTVTVQPELEPAPFLLSEIVVGASRVPEPAMDAPAAVSRVPPALQRDYGPTGQVAQALVRLPGVDAAQTGVNDWNVNTRGFNTTNTRRVLVLMDGRDLALAFLGSQEWPALSMPLSDLGRIELLRGPGSALYGANAFSGVLNITTPAAHEVVGTKLAVAGGELSTFQGDIRHAGVFGAGRFGYRVHAGYVRSDTWARSRTDIAALAREYAGAIDTVRYPVRPPVPGYDLLALKGQRKEGPSGSPGVALGDRDPVTRRYGGVRFDYYAPPGGTLSAETGWSRNQNESSVTGVGRFQIGRADRPWARVAWESERLKAMAYYSGRRSRDQIALSAGTEARETSAIFHGELQYNRPVLAGKGRVVVGGSARALSVDSHHTLLPPEHDDRTDGYYSGYGQFEYDFTPGLRLIAASRVDGGDLFDTEFSPKAAVVWSVNDRHALRLTVNRAFKTPVILEYFLAVPAGAPADFRPLEAGLRASPLGPVLTGVPGGQLFTSSAAVPVLALGNEDLDVEGVTSWEVGYKAQVSPRLLLTVDAYYARLSGFVTELLPGVNLRYPPWTAPSGVPEQYRPVVESTVREALVAAGQPLAAAGLTRLPDGRTAIVVSIGNAGRARDHGLELGVRAQLPRGLELDANYTLFGFKVDRASLVPGQQVLPNTPRHKGNVSVAYSQGQGFELRASARFVSAYDWAGGVWLGRVPAQQTVDLVAGYLLTSTLKVQLTAMNLFDQRRYQVFGGPVIGRRVLAGLTATF